MEKTTSEGNGAVGVILINGRLLIDLRNMHDHMYLWELPGGGIEKGETPAFALKRELEEELGIKVKKMEWLGAKNQAVHWGHTEFEHYFLVTEIEGEPFPKAQRELKQVKWVHPDELKNIINLGWRFTDCLFFLARKLGKYKSLYHEIKNRDSRPLLSFPYFAYSGTIETWRNPKKLNHQSVFREEEAELKKILSKYNGSVLEVGPGFGRVTNLILKRFKSVDLLEVNPDFRTMLIGKFGNRVRFIDGTTEKFKADKKYNVVVCTEALEHIKNKYDFVGNVRAVLLKGGVFILTLDNTESAWRQTRDTSRKLHNISAPEYYTKIKIESMVNLLRDAGFSVAVSELGYDYYVSIPVGHRNIPLPQVKHKKQPYMFVITASLLV